LGPQKSQLSDANVGVVGKQPPIEVFAEWRGKAFYLNVRYHARSRKVEDDFVVRHTRMTLTGFGRFDLAYFRHTDKWFTVYRGLPTADCFREIEENEIFWPMTWRGQRVQAFGAHGSSRTQNA
jgi:trehalose utilization protein